MTMKFIPAIRELIIKRCPMPEDDVHAYIDNWENGEVPAEGNLMERGVHEMCEWFENDINAKTGGDG